MAPHSRTVTLLVLTSQDEDAEGLMKSLRNGGLAVRGIFTSEPARMEELLSSNPFELILCCEYDPAIELNICMRQYRELDTDIPLVIIADEVTESSVLIDALRSGATTLTEHGDTDHLRLVVDREIADLRHRRSKDRLRERRHALEVDGLQLVYQPIVSLKGDSQESYSVLLRLREDDRTLLEAKDFLNAASRSGQMVAVDRWVIRKAIAEVAAQRVRGEKINFFVNVDEETVQEEKLLLWICDCLREFQARGNWLTFQVREDHARRHAAVFSRLSEGLRKVRCRVALNRFGDDPNPDLLLRSLHPDYVKFVPELGQGLADDRSKRQRLWELTKLTREAGVKIIVTGVEDARSLTVLWTAGIDYVQGYFLQKPSTSIGTT